MIHSALGYLNSKIIQTRFQVTYSPQMLDNFQILAQFSRIFHKQQKKQDRSPPRQSQSNGNGIDFFPGIITNNMNFNNMMSSSHLSQAPMIINQVPQQNINQNLNDQQQNKNPNPKYHTLRQVPKPPNIFNPQEPYIKITQMKSSFSSPNTLASEYIITAEGMIGSEKNTITEDIMIGRCRSIDIDQQHIIPNDIVLPMQDRAISRIHCKIITESGFKYNKQLEIPDYFIEFMRTQKKNEKIIDSSTLKFYLPQHIIHLIWLFAQPSRQFYIQDIGSVFGTYIKLSNSRPQNMERGQTYFIGAENTFTIIDCQTESEIQSGKKYTTKEFISKLIAQQYTVGSVFGLTVEENKQLELATQNYRQNLHNETFFVDNNPYARPFIEIELSNQQQDHVTETFIFFGPPVDLQNPMCIEHPTNIYRIGRGGEDNHIRIGNNTISRKQSRFWYCQQKQKWLICDGDFNRESSNGSWISLQNSFNKELRQESQPRILEQGTEIKISDSILKFEMFNINKKKPTKKPKVLFQQFMDLVI